MRTRFPLFACAVILVALSSTTSAATIERSLLYSLGPVHGVFGDGQTLSGVGTFFNDDPFMFVVGDTLVFDILFDHPLQVFDFGDPTYEVFSFGLQTVPGSPGFNGTWLSSIQALEASGDIWPSAIVSAWQGGGVGVGWGGVGVNVTDHEGIFRGIRWITQLTSAKQGAPLTLSSFTGVQLTADGIKVLPVTVPAPGTMTECAAGILAVMLRRLHRAQAPRA